MLLAPAPPVEVEDAAARALAELFPGLDAASGERLEALLDGCGVDLRTAPPELSHLPEKTVLQPQLLDDWS